MDNIMVSICCLAYNHGNYIRDALEGFLMQKTTFKFEVLIHDDASSDNTPEIIREFEKKYPDIIKPIYQSENQYSKGIKITTNYQFPRVKGKYIAFCEGDDCWIDQNKLQMQIEYMESHPDCTLHVCAAYQVNESRKVLREIHPYKGDKLLDIEIFFDKKINYPMASLVFPARLNKQLPDYLLKAPVGDFPTVMHCLSQGNGYYCDRIMTEYRTGVPGSWTTLNSGTHKLLKHYDQMKKMYLEFNVETDKRYEDTINTVINELEMNRMLLLGNFREAKKTYPNLYKKMTKKELLRRRIMQQYPKLTQFIRKLKNVSR